MAVALCRTAYLNTQSLFVSGILGIISGTTRDPLAKWESFLQGVTAEGNAVAVFNGLSPQQSDDTDFIGKIYFLGNYVAYPRRLYVCDDATRFSDKQLAAQPFSPTAAWLAEHHVRCIVTFSVDPERHMHIVARKI